MSNVTWYKLVVNSTQVAADEIQRRKDAFDQHFSAARAPRTMALFQQAREDGGVDLLLTPDCREHAAEFLKEWRCTPCDRPSMIGLHLLVGHAEITYYMP